ncbi:CcdB family protein [Aquariibacter albus]|uniref:Toxin CcdB n=1 Tax=Aquariibacter albus TaxID=2759899 RepID=A0A839HPS2_9BURK|nr:CcdB family protein [Aquariibacter albus]MBB1161011.1 CcdB family protein [Aquariibacter albus]
MARYDLYRNPDPTETEAVPFLLDVQNEHIDGLATRVVIPLRPTRHFGPRADRLHPLLEVEGESLVLDTAALAAVPQGWLRERVGSLRAQREPIQTALDTLFGAY